MRTLVLAALLLAPLASGQTAVVEPTLNVFVEDPGRAFLPGTNESVSIVLNYAPGQGGRGTPAPKPDRPEDVAPTRITLAVKAQPSWVTAVTFEPPEILVNMSLQGPNSVTQATYPARATAILTVAPDAPALVRESFIVTATAEPNGNIQGKTAESPDLKLRATTVGLLNVTTEDLVILPGGRWSTVPFTVRNDGNSDIIAKINVTVRPEYSQVEFSDTLELKRNESKIVEVRIRTPWTAAELGTLELEAVPIVDSEPGPAARAEVAVRGESAVPGAGGAWLALGVLVALLARRA